MPLSYLARIAQTPAPTSQEGERADLMAQLWGELGYATERDSVGNVLTRITPPGTEGRPALLLAAHLDTVFEAGTDVRVREDGGRLIGPGVGDNSASLAVVTALLRDLRGHTDMLSRPLWVAANVGEEGLGDLRGSKHLLAQHRRQLGAFIAVDGYLGVAVTRGVGVRRYRATFLGPGGHSWGDQGPSALHALGRAIRALYALPLPTSPRTTLNVGMASGGTSVNSIAGDAELLLDLRSLGPDELTDLDRRALGALHAAARETGVTVRIERVGDRPGGDLHSGALLPLIREAAREVRTDLRTASSSTDANAAAPYGLSAVAVGVYRGGNAHRHDEWVQTGSLAPGLSFLRHIVELYQRQPVA
ncbi:M20/M25/M40 family metallo-hydrolase [Deinococcus aerophilus]|uniref:Acetylornithine deacetylase n=1 Tax=Deinococcus aerophilus TaxID=522488 RepID=A0ABQ2GSC6_9DEIO|nr:M20/M25/M40 family metallo-hydrolase [Deinococcus aerophilus]GGM11069.1 acetylornithine deacetylase [Deinococcus aerophilus]